MVQRSEANMSDRPIASPVARWLQCIAVVAAALMMFQAAGYAFFASGYDIPRGTLGINPSVSCDSNRFCMIDRVAKGSPADRFGITPGDELRLDRFWERHRRYDVGQAVGATVRHAGRDRHLEMVTAPRSFFAPTYILGGITSLIVCLIALVILTRSGRRRTGLLLGLALIAYGLPGNYPRFWQNDPSLYPGFLLGLSLIWAMTPVLMLSTLRSFRIEVIGQTPRWLDRMIWIIAAGQLLIYAWSMTVELNVAPLFGISDGLSLLSLGTSIGSFVAPVALADGWRYVPTASRTRYAFMWAAVSALSACAMIDPVSMLTGDNYVEASWPVIIELAALMLGAALFAYAILRHRVIDLGFAINRTLVFSALSFLLLLTFGLVEWGTEKLLPLESHEASVVIDAAVALGLFLAFHRIHEWVEHGVERLFFHRWHLSQKALERFVGEASYITGSDILLQRTVDAIRSYADGAEAAIYSYAGDGYALAAGGLAGQGALLDLDLRALVSMRAERVPAHDALLNGSLLLPMTHRADVTGFVILGPKPSGDPYRPDEETLLAEVVQRLGHDLHALQIEQLVMENAKLTARLEARTAAV
jgi:hypothetical protein